MIQEKYHRFLIVRTDRMGDVILSTPVLTAIKQSYPHAETTMLIRDYTKDLISGHPDLDNYLIDDDAQKGQGIFGLFKLAKKLNSKKFDVALILHPTFRLALACRLAKIPMRIGTAYRLYSFLFNNKVHRHRKNTGRHECDLNLEMAKTIGAKTEKVAFKFYIPATAFQRVENILAQNGIDENSPFVVIHPGSGGSALDWPLQKFGKLAQKIQNDVTLPVVLTGSSSEVGLVSRVQKAANNRCIRVDGELATKELAALLKRATLVIANSTGPLHLAVAVGTSVVGLYCPIVPCRPERWGPYGQLDSVIMPPISKCKTQKPKNRESGNCMDLISVDRVFEFAKQKLMGKATIQI